MWWFVDNKETRSHCCKLHSSGIVSWFVAILNWTYWILTWRFSVRLGEHTISTAIDCDDPSQRKTCNTNLPLIQNIEIEIMKLHEGYDFRTKINDIALIRLQKEAYFTGIYNVETICLPVLPEQYIENMKEDRDMTLSGWSQTENGNSFSDVLLQSKFSYTTQVDCETRFKEVKTSAMFVVQETHLVVNKHWQ